MRRAAWRLAVATYAAALVVGMIVKGRRARKFAAIQAAVMDEYAPLFAKLARGGDG